MRQLLRSLLLAALISRAAEAQTATVTPSMIFFGDQRVNTTSGIRTVTLLNSGTVPLTITNISTTGEFSATHSCATVNPGSTCIISVTFTPTSGGFKSATLTVTNSASGSPHTVPLAGVGTVGRIEFVPASLVFTPDVIGSSSSMNIYVYNIGNVALTVTSATASGDFIAKSNCGASLNPSFHPTGPFCSITVTFSPTVEGLRSGTLTITSDSPLSPFTTSLSGTGLASLPVPVITSISPTSRKAEAHEFTLIVRGSDFSSKSVIRWGGVDRPTTLVNSTLHALAGEFVVPGGPPLRYLTAMIPASDAATLGTTAVSVFNPTPGGGVSNTADLTIYSSKVRRDFNGDSKSDILWRDPAGNVSMWQMNGSAITSEVLVGNVWIGWKIVGSADFNGDGKMDILWQDPSGMTVVWLMNGGTLSSYSVIGTLDPQGAVAGVADFNGDGKPDILSRGKDGDVAFWLIDGSNIKNEFLGNVWHDWTIVGTGDFNGDHRTDLLWRHISGDVAIWLMNGTSIVTGTTVANIWTGWTISGTGDFNGDGNSDILWRSLTGDVAIWLMNGTTRLSGTLVGNIWTGWTISGTGDFNGDNRSDILWRSESGDVAIWLMNGASISSYAGIGNVAERTAQ